MDVIAFNCSHNYGSASQLSKAILSKLTGNFANCSATYWTSTKSPTASIYSVPSSALCRALQNQLTLYGLTPSRTWFSVVLPHLTSFSLTFSDIKSLIQNQCFQRFKNLTESSSFFNINFFFSSPHSEEPHERNGTCYKVNTEPGYEVLRMMSVSIHPVSI